LAAPRRASRCGAGAGVQARDRERAGGVEARPGVRTEPLELAAGLHLDRAQAAAAGEHLGVDPLGREAKVGEPELGAAQLRQRRGEVVAADERLAAHALRGHVGHRGHRGRGDALDAVAHRLGG
jgi:hypothetical protein